VLRVQFFLGAIAANPANAALAQRLGQELVLLACRPRRTAGSSTPSRCML